jgi:hypothetical protein
LDFNVSVLKNNVAAVIPNDSDGTFMAVGMLGDIQKKHLCMTVPPVPGVPSCTYPVSPCSSSDSAHAVVSGLLMQLFRSLQTASRHFSKSFGKIIEKALFSDVLAWCRPEDSDCHADQGFPYAFVHE